MGAGAMERERGMAKILVRLTQFHCGAVVQFGIRGSQERLAPRIYVAARAGWLNAGGVTDKSGGSASQFTAGLRSYEVGVGYWLGRNELLKGSYEWLQIAGSSGARTNVLGAEFVFKFNSPAWTFR
jgi:hypothetical protein